MILIYKIDKIIKRPTQLSQHESIRCINI